MDKKVKLVKGHCRVCNEETSQIFNIKFRRAYICKGCETRIVKQSVMEAYG